MAIDNDVNYVKNRSLRSLFHGELVPASNTITTDANLANKNWCDEEINSAIRNDDYVQFDPTTNVEDRYGDLGLAAKQLYAMILEGRSPSYDSLPKGIRGRIKNRYKFPALGVLNPITGMTGE
ncbi:MAG: hypothetical protein ACTSPK_00135 [Candidatus Heimdallarchaeota archaeon]